MKQEELTIKEALDILEGGRYEAYIYVRKNSKHVYHNVGEIYTDASKLYDRALSIACDCMRECLLLENDWK